MEITLEDISFMFDWDNIRDGQSIAKLKALGGLAGLQQKLQTSFTKGITNKKADHAQRRRHYGDNRPIFYYKSLFKCIIENFHDDILTILSFLTLFSTLMEYLIKGEAWQGLSIVLGILLIVLPSAFLYYHKQKYLEQFRRTDPFPNHSNVIREGKQQRIPADKLLVGDIIEIAFGDILEVDGILVEGTVSMDESSISGDVPQIKKAVPETYEPMEGKIPFLISSSRVMQGTGKMVVAAVGANSVWGKIKMRLVQWEDETPLQGKLSMLACYLSNALMYWITMILVASFSHYIYNCAGDYFFSALFSLQTLLQVQHSLTIIIVILVIAASEHLPLTISIALAYSVGPMREQKCFVRYLQACETMGTVTDICASHVLHTNHLTPGKIFIEETVYEAYDVQACSQTCRILGLSITNNTSATPSFQKHGSRIVTEQIGNRTECALLELAYGLGYNYQEWREKQKIRKVFPFNSWRKKMCTVYNHENKYYVFVKGSPQLLIPSCTKYIDNKGKVSKITPSFVENLRQNITKLEDEPMKNILLAYKEVEDIPDEWYEVERELIFIAMVGIENPLQPDVEGAVALCHTAGITVRMITSDSKNIAIINAKQAGILDPNWEPSEGDYTVMQGPQFRQFVGALIHEGEGHETLAHMDNFKVVAQHLRVLARSSSQDKYLLTLGLRLLGHVVALSGDGSGDSHALKKADVGFTMSISTEVAKEASGILLLDDSFVSLVGSIKWGRNIFACERKCLQFSLTTSIVTVLMTFIAEVMVGQSPLTYFQLLWVGLLTSTVASTAIIAQPPDDRLQKPERIHDNLFTSTMIKNIMGQACCQIIILSLVLFQGAQIAGILQSFRAREWNYETGKHYSMYFHVFILLQIFNLLNQIKVYPQKSLWQNLCNNGKFLAVVVGAFVLQLGMIEFGGKLVRVVRLSCGQNLLCVVLGTFSLWMGLALQLLPNMVIKNHGVQVGRWKFNWCQPRAA